MATEPKIPTLKDSQKPQVKVRGLQAGVTLLERLKQFKKKDLAFILAGLGTLFMAPLAEHFMMSPEAGDSALHPGWGPNGAKGMFDNGGAGPYEPGTSGMAPGSAIGGGSDIITPLNVRDPSALVMGPGATQQPPAGSNAPATPPPTAPVSHSDSDLKDALAASARGAGAGLKAAKALLPIPKIALSGSGGLRGLGVANGGSTSSAGGGPISSANLVSGKGGGGSNMGGVRAAPGYKGVARGQTGGDGNSAIDALRKAADAAAGQFNRGSAATALNNAANQAIPTGNGSSNGGLGAGGTGSTDKATGGNSSKDGKSVGESLAFLKAKAMQEAQIDLWKKEQEAGDSRLELLKMRNTIAESIASSIGTSLGTFVTCPITAGNTFKTCFGSQADKPYNCMNAATGGLGIAIPASQVASSYNAGCVPAKAGAVVPGQFLCGINICSCNQQPVAWSCQQGGSPVHGDPTGDGQDHGVTSLLSGVASDMGKSPVLDMGTACKKLLDTPKIPAKSKEAINNYVKAAGLFVQIREANEPPQSGQSAGDCQAPTAPLASSPLVGQLNGIGTHLLGANGTVKMMDDLTKSKDPNDALVGQLGADVGTGADDKKVAGNIATFSSDEQKVHQARDTAQGALTAASGALTPEGLTADFTAAGDYKGSDVAGIVKSITNKIAVINAGASSISNMVVNLDKAAKALGSTQNQDPAAALSLLQGAAGKSGSGQDGTAYKVVQVNNGLDTVGGSTKNMDKITAPLVPPSFDHQDSDPAPAGGINPGTMAQPISDANDKVTKANAAVAKYVGPPVDASSLDPANSALKDAGTAVRTVDADELAVDAALRAKTNEAMGALALAASAPTGTPTAASVAPATAAK